MFDMQIEKIHFKIVNDIFLTGHWAKAIKDNKTIYRLTLSLDTYSIDANYIICKFETLDDLDRYNHDNSDNKKMDVFYCLFDQVYYDQLIPKPTDSNITKSIYDIVNEKLLELQNND